MTSQYSIVVTTPKNKRTLEAALYSHTRIAGAEENLPEGRWAGRSVYVLETIAQDKDQAVYLATYQSGRLGSFGCFYVDGPFDTYTAAEQEAGESFDAYPEMVHTRTPSQVAAQSLAREFGTDVSEWEV